MLNLLHSFIVIAGLIMPLGTKNEEGLEALIEMEFAFASAASEMGVGKAFCTYLADEAIIFQPKPVKGKAWYENYKDSGISLVWRPIYAEISASKDFGYTTGPWHFEAKGQKTKRFGHYVSVWRKEETGPWRVIMDVGIHHKKSSDSAAQAAAEVASRKNLEGERKPVSMESEGKTLLERDRAFSRASNTDGMAKAFKTYAAEDVRLYREGNLPVQGKDKALFLLSKEKGAQTWKPLKAVISTSTDLGYTYGFLEIKAQEQASRNKRFSYFRIWRKMGSTWFKGERNK